MADSLTRAPQALTKSLSLLALILQDRKAQTLAGIADCAGIPLSTAHRLAVGLEEEGFLLRAGRGRYAAGPTLMRLATASRDWGQFAARTSRPILAKLSRRTGRAAHLGVLEDNMITYLVKVGDRRGEIHSRQGLQLEAYCSGLGKALLAHLPVREQDEYLAGGPFVRLTPSTITLPEDFRQEFARIRERGYAIDDGEILPGLRCIAMPIKSRHGVLAAISLIMTHKGDAVNPDHFRPLLGEAACEIERQLFPYEQRA